MFQSDFILFVLFGCITLLFLFPIINNLWLYLKHPRVDKPAILIDKEINFNTKKTNDYLLVFQLFSGKQLTFSVTPNIYSLFFKGDKGILTYKGEQFIYFNKKY